MFRSVLRPTIVSSPALVRALPAFALALCAGSFVALSTLSANAQDQPPRATNGQATTETYNVEPRTYLLGDFHGERQRLADRGFALDAFYVNDALSNVTGGYSQSNTAWGRIHASVDLDLGKLIHANGLTFHARGAFQHGANLGGEYLGSLANPSSLVSYHAARLDSWWLQQSILDDRIIFRAGQFAGQDSYGVREYGASFLSAPMGYAFGNLGNVYESFDPEGTPAAEVRFVPTAHFYVKTAVLSGNRDQPLSDSTGFNFRIQNSPVFVSETGFLFNPSSTDGSTKTLGKKTPTSRGNLPGTYKLGSAVNPGKFTDPVSGVRSAGNYIIYAEASQAVYRRGTIGSDADRGLDLTLGYDWSPSDVNKQNTQMTAGARYTGLFSRRKQDTIAVGYVRTQVSDHFAVPATFLAPAQSAGSEQVVEVSYRALVTPWLVFQPDYQHFTDPGGLNHSASGNASVLGFRTKITF